MAINITFEDLIIFAPNITEEQANQLIKDAIAIASQFAPCILDPDFPEEKASIAEAIIRGTILRWFNRSGNDSLSSVSVSAGEFSKTESFDSRYPLTNGYLNSEKEQLEKLCGKAKGKVFHIGNGTRKHNHNNIFNYPDYDEFLSCPECGEGYVHGITLGVQV